VHTTSQQTVSIRDDTNDARVSSHYQFYILSVMPWLRLALKLALRTVRRPSLGLQLVRVAWRFRSTRWYRQFPFLPVPDPTYLRWRMYTAYGDYGAVPSVTDAERYARWASQTE
jgi:hypothetical protein